MPTITTTPPFSRRTSVSGPDTAPRNASLDGSRSANQLLPDSDPGFSESRLLDVQGSSHRRTTAGKLLGEGPKLLEGIKAGTGKTRSDVLAHATKAGKVAAKVLGVLMLGPGAMAVGLGAAVLLFAVRLFTGAGRALSEKVLEPRAEKRFQDMGKSWIEPAGKRLEGGGLIDRDGVLTALIVHAQRMKSPINPLEVCRLVNTGERIAAALTEGDPRRRDDGTAVVSIDGHDVHSCVYTTRALTWYAMAQAAKADVAAGIAFKDLENQPHPMSNMVESGAFKVEDPGNRLFKFLRHQATVGARASTHFNAEVADPENHEVAGLVSRIKHYGLDDPGKRFPGAGGALVFNKLVASVDDGPPELYFKIESTGCPKWFAAEAHHTVLDRVFKTLANVDYNLGHCTSFLDSLRGKSKSVAGGKAVTRQEHVYKGLLGKSLNAPFKELLKYAIKGGHIQAEAHKLMAGVHEFGLEFMKRAVHAIELANHHGDLELHGRCDDLRHKIDVAQVQLDTRLDGSSTGMARRGGEVHQSWLTRFHPLSANDFETPGPARLAELLAEIPDETEADPESVTDTDAEPSSLGTDLDYTFELSEFDLSDAEPPAQRQASPDSDKAAA